MSASALCSLYVWFEVCPARVCVCVFVCVCVQINIDSVTRELVYANMARGADLMTFDPAQRRIQALMDKDSYPRFISSDLYQYLLQQAS